MRPDRTVVDQLRLINPVALVFFGARLVNDVLTRVWRLRWLVVFQTRH
jgi:hypothetical protein